MKDIGVSGDTTVQLESEGDGRYAAYLFRPAKGRMRIGTVLGGSRNWTGEPIGKAPSVQSKTRTGAGRALGTWALTQPGGKALVA